MGGSVQVSGGDKTRHLHPLHSQLTAREGSSPQSDWTDPVWRCGLLPVLPSVQQGEVELVPQPQPAEEPPRQLGDGEGEDCVAGGQ